MKQTTKRFLSLLGGLGLLTGALILYFEFVQPAYREVQEIKSRQLGQQLFLENEQKAVQKVQNLISAYQAQSAVQEVVSLSLPAGEDFAGVLAQLNGLARASGLTLNSAVLSAGGGTDAGAVDRKLFALQRPVKRMLFGVQLAGSYEDLKVFLERLETNVRIFDMVSFSMQPAAGERFGGNFFNYSLSIAAYYQPISGALGL